MNEPDDIGPVHIDIERMNRALAGPSVTLPPELKTFEEFNAFMLGAAAAFEAMAKHATPKQKLDALLGDRPVPRVLPEDIQNL